MRADRFIQAFAGADLRVAEDALALVGEGRVTRVDVTSPATKFSSWMAYAPALEISSIPAVLAGIERSPDLLLTRRLTPRLADALRRHGIDAIDEDGNVTIRRDGVHIEVRGRRGDADVGVGRSYREAGRSTATNPFSPRRSQVVFVLLVWPQLVNEPVRAVARAAGVSVGLAQETIRLLDDLGHLADRHGLIVRHPDLADRWLAAYPTGLGRTLGLGAFHATHPDDALDDVDGEVSGEAAVPELISGTTATIYVSEIKREWIIRHRWRTDRPPNVFLRRRFWEQSPAALSGRARSGPARGRRVPDLLIRADLAASREPRQLQVEREMAGADAHS